MPNDINDSQRAILNFIKQMLLKKAILPLLGNLSRVGINQPLLFIII